MKQNNNEQGKGIRCRQVYFKIRMKLNALKASKEKKGKLACLQIQDMFNEW